MLRIPSNGLQPDGGAEKWGHYGREKGASDVVTLWPTASGTASDVESAAFSSGMVFHGFRLLGAVGLAFDLQDDRALDEPVEERHRQGAVGEIVSPLIEVHVGDYGRGALLIA